MGILGREKREKRKVKLDIDKKENMVVEWQEN
jgi:hypothetical protein